MKLRDSLPQCKVAKNISRKILMSLAICISSSLTSPLAQAVGLDLLTNLNGPQDAAADAIQGADINGVRPLIADVAGKGLCQSIATGTSQTGTAKMDKAATGELGIRCAWLVGTADPSLGLPNLGISLAQVAQALQQVVPEETEIMGSGSTDTMHDQNNNVSSRLQYIRTGVSSLPIAGLHITGDTLAGGNAGEKFSRLGVFINGDYATGEKDSTFNESGFDFDSYGLTAGIDYRFADSFIAGIAIGYSESEAEVDDNLGSTDGEGTTFTVYGSWFKDNFYVDGSVTTGSYDYDGKRNINYGSGDAIVTRTFESDTDGDQTAWSIGGGYNIDNGSLNYSFYSRLEAVDVDIDGYQERVMAANSTLDDGSLNNDWAMRIEDQEIESMRGVLGAQVAYSLSKNFGVLQPYASLEYQREFEDDIRVARASYVNDPFFDSGDRSYIVELATDEPDQSYYQLTVGSVLLRPGGTQWFVNYGTLLGLDDVTSHRFTFGARLEL